MVPQSGDTFEEKAGNILSSAKPTLAIYGIQDRANAEYPLYVHDHNMALMEGGKIRYFLQLERETRIKRDNKLYENLHSLLKEKKLLGEDYDLVFIDNVVGRTFLTSNGEARFEAPLNRTLATGLEKGKCWWFGKTKDAWVLNHELAHIYTCLPFFGNFRENSLLVHFDGGASQSNFSAWIFRDNKVKLFEYHWDLKPLSSIYNANALVFSIIGAKLSEQNSVPGKFMGYAGWGKAGREIADWLSKYNFFQDIWNRKSLFFDAVRRDWKIDLKSFDQNNDFIQDVAATLQQIFIDGIMEKIGQLSRSTGCTNLYYTGGSALNIIANSAIVEGGLFEEVYIPPCTEDSGLALGAAACLEWQKNNVVERVSPYLNNWNIENYQVSFSCETVGRVAEELVKGGIIGICNGFSEAGPRALGNRSLLARPDSRNISELLNREIKGREWYRPLAPVALARNVAYFTGKDPVNHLAKYMLLNFRVLPDKFDELKGVVHADGTARFQALFKREDNPFLFELLDRLDRQYKIKALINTSFNLRGEPIVHTSEDAFNTARKMKIMGVVLNGHYHLVN